MYKEKRNILLTLFLFLQIGLVHWSSYYPGVIETYYSRGVYPYLARFLRRLFGWLQVSVGDLVYLLLILLLVRLIYQIIKNPRDWKPILFRLGAAISLFYFLFYAFWGLNYSRVPVAENLGLVNEPYDIEKIEALTGRILKRTRILHKHLSPHDTLPVSAPYTKRQILSMTRSGYSSLSDFLPQYAYHNPSIKNSIFSLPLTYMGFAGYLNPLTGEAQVDALIPEVSYALTASHEVAHQLGVAYENEANFIGFLAAAMHEDPYFNYASMLFALRYALSDIRRYDQKLFESYLEKVPEGVLENLRESDRFWQSYQNPLEPLFKGFYDGYLKYNQQEDGLETYNQITGLLISADEVYAFDIY
ncbi:MAG: DUF3810 domain-containing protein [Lutimonas sp.]